MCLLSLNGITWLSAEVESSGNSDAWPEQQLLSFAGSISQCHMSDPEHRMHYSSQLKNWDWSTVKYPSIRSEKITCMLALSFTHTHANAHVKCLSNIVSINNQLFQDVAILYTKIHLYV